MEPGLSLGSGGSCPGAQVPRQEHLIVQRFAKQQQGFGTVLSFGSLGFSSVNRDIRGFCLLWRSSPPGIKSTWTVHFGDTLK